MKKPTSPKDPIRPLPPGGKARAKKPAGPKRTSLDWKAYFLEFCKVHGEPVEYQTGLLFRDGWRYAMEYSGPEYPPPKDHEQLDRLALVYWQTRHRLLSAALTKVLIEKERVDRIRADHSLPLRQVVITGAGEQRRKSTGEYDPRPLEDRLRWLRTDVAECEAMVAQIQQYYKGRADGDGTGGDRTGNVGTQGTSPVG